MAKDQIRTVETMDAPEGEEVSERIESMCALCYKTGYPQSIELELQDGSFITLTATRGKSEIIAEIESENAKKVLN